MLKNNAYNSLTFGSYVELLLTNPGFVAVAFFLFTATLSSIAVYFRGGDFSADARRGFETRGTPLANVRLALETLARIAAASATLKQQSAAKAASPTPPNVAGDDDATTATAPLIERCASHSIRTLLYVFLIRSV